MPKKAWGDLYEAKMREQETTAVDPDTAVTGQSKSLSIGILDETHRNPITTAIANILSTKLAKITYAQIIDGLPLSIVYEEAYADPLIDPKHPAYNHEDFCSGVVEDMEALSAGFVPDDLTFDAKVSPGCRNWCW